MQTIVVKSSADLQNIITQLTNYNSQYKENIERLASEQANLKSSFKGAASDSMDEVFAQDKAKFDRLHELINDFIKVLKETKARLEEAESRSKQLIERRSGR